MGVESVEKAQPWKAHYVPKPAEVNCSVVSYQEKKGAEIIADGGAICPAVDDVPSNGRTVEEANMLCPHLGPITNPTL